MKTRKLTRREFLVTSAAVAAGTVLAACQPAAAPTEAPKEEPTKEEAPMEAKELYGIGSGHESFPILNERFTEETGIKVTYDTNPNKFEEIWSKFWMWGESQYDGVDFMNQDDGITAMWSQMDWVVDLDYLMDDAYKADLADAVVGLNKEHGKVARMMWFIGGLPFYYNMDLVPEAPETWDEMVEFAQKMTDPDNDVWGWRPNAGTHVSNLTEMMINYAGGDPYTADDDGTLVALQFIWDWVNTFEITPVTTVNEAHQEMVALMSNGKAGMTWGYDGTYKGLLDVEGGILTRDNLGVARFPDGPGGDAPTYVHAWGFYMPKWTKKKEMAGELISYMTRKDNVKEICLTGGNTPPLKSLYEDADIQKDVWILSAGPGWDELMRGSIFRCPMMCVVQSAAYIKAFQDAYMFLAANEKSPEETHEWLAAEIKMATAEE